MENELSKEGWRGEEGRKWEKMGGTEPSLPGTKGKRWNKETKRRPEIVRIILGPRYSLI